mgnify:CR=1 FL=1
MNRHIDTLLVANRGEIACRVMRTAKAMGLTTVAVHSAIDASARHAREADIRIDLGGAKPAESYLRIDKLIEAAKASGAQAIHPGYGFLSENAEFARAIEQAGLIFLGPPASAIDAMGSKSAAKALMEEAGVPLVPGYHGEAQDVETFRAAAEKIGYPVLLKATAGGGGKGMKVVEREADLAEALASAQREAQSSFGDSRMLVEKYVLKPRHVEIQVFADQHGNCLYLNERDCSIQRRHQKVVEEAPAPGITAEQREQIGKVCVEACIRIGYRGAGTFEFLYEDGRFYFIEMNTRIQVEHPVTEMITGVDLIKEQLRVAAGEKLRLKQSDVVIRGAAVECRINAEDAKTFIPSPGTITRFHPPGGNGVRWDSHIYADYTVPPNYDSMVGKLITYGASRDEAMARMRNALDEIVVDGIKTNIPLHRDLTRDKGFLKGGINIHYLEKKLGMDKH